MEYLNTVKTWGYYGSTFFPPCKSVGNRNLHSKVLIGVNYEGIRLLKPKTKVCIILIVIISSSLFLFTFFFFFSFLFFSLSYLASYF